MKAFRPTATANMPRAKCLPDGSLRLSSFSRQKHASRKKSDLLGSEVIHFRSPSLRLGLRDGYRSLRFLRL